MTNRDADGPAASASLPHGACPARGEPAVLSLRVSTQRENLRFTNPQKCSESGCVGCVHLAIKRITLRQIGLNRKKIVLRNKLILTSIMPKMLNYIQVIFFLEY